MTDEQIAQAFVQQVRNHCPDAVAVLTLTAIIGEARATERARCAEIVSRFSVDDCAWFDSIKQSMQEAMLETSRPRPIRRPETETDRMG